VSATPQPDTTPSRLFVSNLSQEATLTSLRVLFASCGDVLDVQFAAERGAPSRLSSAFVTMATSAAADKAVLQLQGRLHCDRILMISRASGDAGRSPSRATAAEGQSPPKEAIVAITQQYRDRHALTYELSCSGGLLTLRFLFPPDDTQDWRVEARLLPGPPLAVTASAPTRERALRALVEAWKEVPSQAGSQPDWERVAAALRGVRAL
jgi:hypothetical protein